MPWTGIMYNFDGIVKNCIRSSGPIGDLKHNTIQDIVTGPVNQTTQQDMLENRPGQRCSPCYKLEEGKSKFDIVSDRVFYLKELKNVDLNTYRVGNYDLQTIDIRWSNLCNFACVYCGPEFSSQWANELKIFKASPDQQQLDNLKDYIFEKAAQLKHVYLAGGEPLLMKQNLELLGFLKQKNPDVNIRVNTNLSKVDTKVFESICGFKNVHWTISIETIEDEFEYIRFGSHWQDFVQNLVTVQQLGHKISFNMLYFLLNYNSLFTCVDFLSGLGFHPNSFIIGALTKPLYLNIRHLPDSVLKLIQSTLRTRIEQQPKYLLNESYQNLLKYIQQPFDKNLEDSFQQLQSLDQRRGLDSKKIFKDLYSLI